MPCVIVAFKVLGWQFLVKTIVGVSLHVLFPGMFESFQWATDYDGRAAMAGLIGSIVAVRE
jgi:uncharacterized membrane-anchored protein YitT (DUF2179 family)